MRLGTVLHQEARTIEFEWVAAATPDFA